MVDFMAKKQDSLGSVAETLCQTPTTKNWEAFGKALKASKAKYYRVFFSGKELKGTQDLTSSYAELYDARETPLARVPIYLKEGKRVEGATIFLKGLRNVNRVD